MRGMSSLPIAVYLISLGCSPRVIFSLSRNKRLTCVQEHNDKNISYDLRTRSRSAGGPINFFVCTNCQCLCIRKLFFPHETEIFISLATALFLQYRSLRKRKLTYVNSVRKCSQGNTIEEGKFIILTRLNVDSIIDRTNKLDVRLQI